MTEQELIKYSRYCFEKSIELASQLFKKYEETKAQDFYSDYIRALERAEGCGRVADMLEREL